MCRNHGTLDSFAAFPYENCLKSVKDTLTSGYKPLQQLANRETEKRRLGLRKVSPPGHFIIPELSKARVGMGGDASVIYYKSVKINGTKLSIGQRDSCCKLKTKDVLIIQSISCQPTGNVQFIGHKFTEGSDYYEYPVKSSELGILRVSKLNTEPISFSVGDIFAKCVLLPLTNSQFLCIPMVHFSDAFL